MVQLGGLEPPTSCSTDRRSNQLSYNCILRAPERRVPNGRETRCNGRLWQGREVAKFKANRSALPIAQTRALFPNASPTKDKARAASPGFGDEYYPLQLMRQSDARAVDQAAGLKIFEALALIGSAVSAAIFWVSSLSSLACAASACACLRVWEVHSSIASAGDLMLSSS